MTLTDLSPPPVGAVSLDAAKTFLRIDTDAEDALIGDLIDTAALHIEDRCALSLITRPQRLRRPVRGGAVRLHRYPVMSIESVSLDEASIDTQANLRARPVTVTVPHPGVVQIDFTAGFGADPANIPTPLRQALLLLVAHFYEHRGDDGAPPIPMMVDALIAPYRGMRL